MKKSLFFLIVFLTSFCFVNAQNFIKTEIDGHTIKVIKYDLKDKRYNFKISTNLDENASSLRKLMQKFNGISAVNGVFFCPADYKKCGGNNFTGNERYVKGNKISHWKSTGDRVVFALDKENKPFLFQTGKINSKQEKNIYYGFGNFPLLLKSGKKTLDYYEKKGLINHKMKIKLPRNFICSDKNKRYIYTGFVYNSSIYEMPKILKNLGCYDALNLDAGKTSSMIYNGKQIIGPGRDLLDGIVIERNGLDTKKILQVGDNFFKKVKKSIDKKTLDEKIKTLKKINNIFDKIKKNIYEKNSLDLFDKKGNIIGYEIKMNKINNLKNIYIINIINSQILKLIKDFEKQQKEEIDKTIFFLF